MNELIEHCLYESGLTAQGCWDELDDYAKEAIERFAKLIVKECADVLDTQIYPPNHPMNSLGYELKEHFGVEHQKSVGKRLMDKYSGALSDLAKS